MPTLGQLCADAIWAAKPKDGTKLSKEQVAAIIDALPKPEAPSTPSKADSSPFGDPKAIPPSPDLVTAYSASIGYPMNGQAWCDAYEQKGWLVGRAKMKNWQSAVRNWKTNNWGVNLKTTPTPIKDYSKI